ncbi:MAG: GNAT family N-acetyltransferase [Clostridium sp.]|uniref:GNAT family N-acetyltransferase n=1 Tax=Clostridium sp. TaxID=1506 RepID=UPI0032176309
MENKVYFHVPKFEELAYRKKIMSQPDTMDYNKGYDISYEGYHKDTGCIDFPENKWRNWHSNRVDKKPEYFYAYITREDDNSFIGEVNLNLSDKDKYYDMGIVLEAKYRGAGYSLEALKKLMKVAFETYDALEVHNDFETTRKSAIEIHKAVGFNIIDEVNGIAKLVITRDDYLSK